MRADFWDNKRVLLTGHTGFKGSWLGLWLTELGAKVSGVGLRPEGTPSLFSQLELDKRLQNHHIADIRNIQEITSIVEATKPQVVLHLAAQALVRRSYTDPLGTWTTNVLGTLNLLEALRSLRENCAVVVVTTDKVYANKEWDYGYRENDRLGGYDPYSASKAAAELAVASWRSSFCGIDRHQTPYLAIATARAGNVIGGGDWASDRIVPDAVRALSESREIEVRNPQATRPWQHVLEPLSGYLLLAEKLASEEPMNNRYADAFNFGPNLEANRSVRELIEEMMIHWRGQWKDISNSREPHEATRLHLQIDKVKHQLGWEPRWDFQTTIARTMNWYKAVESDGLVLSHCLEDISSFEGNKSIRIDLK